MFKKTIPFMLTIFVSSLSISSTLFADPPIVTLGDSKPATPKSLMKQLGETKESLDTWHSRVLAKQAYLNQVLDHSSLDALDLSKLKAEADSKQAMSDLLELLDDEAEALETAYEALAPNLVHYRRATVEAPTKYEQYSKQWDNFAHEANDPSMKELYANWADTARSMAKSYSERGSEVDKYAETIDEKMQLISASRVFFERIQEFIEVMPSDIGLEIAQFEQRLDLYIKTFRDAAIVMRSVSDHLASPGKVKSTKDGQASPSVRKQASSRSGQINGMLESLTVSPQRH